MGKGPCRGFCLKGKDGVRCVEVISGMDDVCVHAHMCVHVFVCGFNPLWRHVKDCVRDLLR